MVPKLTRVAAEVLSDILLNTLQQNGLEKTEALEQSFFDAFGQLSDGQHADTVKSITVDAFAVVYKMQETDVVILTIVHTSRLPKTLKA